MFSYSTPEQRVPQDHPLRPILAMVNVALQRIDEALEKMYAAVDRAGEAAASAAAADALQRAQRADADEQMQFNLLFRWFVGR